MFEIFRRTMWPEVPFDDIKKRARILVIDDLDFPYKDLFERDKYTIEKWNDVEDLSKLESGYYDIILLDVQGVGREHSAEQGLGILQHLRKTSPTILIIAYSSADWSLKYQEFFRLADATLAKSSDYVDFKRKVDELLRNRFSLGFYLGRVRSILGQQVDDPEKVDRLVRRSIRKRSYRKLQGYLEGRTIDQQLVNTVINVVQTAISIASLWKN